MSARPRLTSDEQPRHPINVALEELFRVVRSEYEPKTPKDKRIADVAKEICRVKWQELDHLVTGIPGHPCIAGNNAVAVVFPLQPAWATYWIEAAAAIDAVDKADACVQD